MSWLFENKETLLLAITSAVTLASIIAKLTPSTVDDKVIGKILNFIAINKK